MKFTLSADPKANPTGARSMPQGFGRFIDVEPGQEFDVYDVTLVSNPTFRDTTLVEPADEEARVALEAAREAAKPKPVEEAPQPEPAEGEPAPNQDQDPVLVAALQDAADRAEQEVSAADQAPTVTPDPDPFATSPEQAVPAVQDPAPAVDAPVVDPAPVPVEQPAPVVDPTPTVEATAPETPADLAADTTTTARARARKEG